MAIRPGSETISQQLAAHAQQRSYSIHAEPFSNRVCSRNITAAILVFQNNETVAMLVSQTNPLGVELFSYANAFFCSNTFA